MNSKIINRASAITSLPGSEDIKGNMHVGKDFFSPGNKIRTITTNTE